jgi:hypothetical protein
MLGGETKNNNGVWVVGLLDWIPFYEVSGVTRGVGQSREMCPSPPQL